MRIIITDGGRADAGFSRHAGDCVARAIAIAARLPYGAVHKELVERSEVFLRTGRKTRAHLHRIARAEKKPEVENGCYPQVYEPWLKELGAVWTPTMGIGTGTTVHLRDGELPATGRHMIRVSGHITVLVDGAIHDNGDPTRGGTRAVYGYWTFPEDSPPPTREVKSKVNIQAGLSEWDRRLNKARTQLAEALARGDDARTAAAAADFAREQRLHERVVAGVQDGKIK